MGTPAVAYNVLLDTGSSDLWLAGVGCGAGCPQNVQAYAPANSSSFANLSVPFSITYDIGFAEGYLATETVQMAGFALPGQVFGAHRCFPVSRPSGL